MTPIPRNKILYNKVKDEAKKKFQRYPSIYASSWIVREYKKRGGTYTSPKKTSTTGTTRWYKEKWIQVIPYLTSGKEIQCGSRNKDNAKACRPLYRKSPNTPITIPELLKIHSKSKLKELARKKKKDMKGRVYWKAGKFYPSKN
jgi:hypothetical protein